MIRLDLEALDGLDLLDLDQDGSVGPDGADGWDDYEDWDDYDEDLDVDDATWRDGLRAALADEYGDASDAELDLALDRMLASVDSAEGFSLAGALNQIGQVAGRVATDPTIGQAVRTAAPIAGGALGTVVGGPVGTALGTQLGTAAASALPARPVRPASIASTAPAATAAPARAVASAAAGSDPAKQALALLLAPDRSLLRSLLATALGEYGQQQVNGVPVARMLGLFNDVVGQAAADADELAYLTDEDWRSPPAEPLSNEDLYARLIARQGRLLDEGL